MGQKKSNFLPFEEIFSHDVEMKAVSRKFEEVTGWRVPVVERAAQGLVPSQKQSRSKRVDVEEKTASRAQLGVETVRGMEQATRLAA